MAVVKTDIRKYNCASNYSEIVGELFHKIYKLILTKMNTLIFISSIIELVIFLVFQAWFFLGRREKDLMHIDVLLQLFKIKL